MYGQNAPRSLDEIYTELIELRSANRLLEKRIKSLEKQNTESAKNMHFIGNNEPSRPTFHTPLPPQTSLILNKP
jgi:hypothetical protein